MKDTKLGFLGEGGNVEFRAEFFNVINHPNFSGQHFSTTLFSGPPPGSTTNDPTPFLEAPSGGHVTQEVLDGQREIQLAVRFEF